MSCFITWAENNGFKKGLHVDRINNNGNYEPVNCKFSTHSENNAIGRKRHLKISSSGHIGVNPSYRGWRSRIKINKKLIEIGRYDLLIEAVLERGNAEVHFVGEYKTKRDGVLFG